MARRRRQRGARKFLLGAAAFVACAAGAFYGARWLFSSAEPTELASRAAHQPEAADSPALRPIMPAPLSAGAGAETDKLPPAKEEKPGHRSAGDKNHSIFHPPTTQPTTLAKLPPSEARTQMEAGFAARDKKDLVAARTLLNKALHGGLPAHDERRVREALTELADQTIFSPRTVLKDDPFVRRYTVQRGDKLALIARRARVPEDFLAELNGISNKHIVRLGSTLKIVDGPFNAAILKKDHLLHLYLADLYLRSFRVALGANGGTPTGVWRISNHLENPGWTDPNTGKRWHPDDPQNPIGEFWIGLDGIEGEAVGRPGFGIHGTIEPQTIGQDVSLGCIRLAADDIAFLYKVLLPGESIATISD